MSEIWKPVHDFPGYEVSNLGRVKSLARIVKTVNGRMLPIKERNLSPGTYPNGYRFVALWLNNEQSMRYVHRLVAEAFIPRREDINADQVNHIDCDKANNLVMNLEWMTRSENIRHAMDNNLMGFGEANSNAKLTASNVIDIREAVSRGQRRNAIAARFNVAKSTIGAIVTGKIWRHAA